MQLIYIDVKIVHRQIFLNSRVWKWRLFHELNFAELKNNYIYKLISNKVYFKKDF